MAGEFKKPLQIHSNGRSRDQAGIISGVSRKSKSLDLLNVGGFVVVFYLNITPAIHEFIGSIGIQIFYGLESSLGPPASLYAFPYEFSVARISPWGGWVL